MWYKPDLLDSSAECFCRKIYLFLRLIKPKRDECGSVKRERGRVLMTFVNPWIQLYLKTCSYMFPVQRSINFKVCFNTFELGYCHEQLKKTYIRRLREPGNCEQ